MTTGSRIATGRASCAKSSYSRTSGGSRANRPDGAKPISNLVSASHGRAGVTAGPASLRMAPVISGRWSPRPWPRSAHTVTAAISRSYSSRAGRLSRPKIGEPISKPSGAKSAQMIVSFYFFSSCLLSCSLINVCYNSQWDGYMLMMRGSSHTRHR